MEFSLAKGGCGSGVGQCLDIGKSLVQFPRSACRSALGQDTEPQTAPEVLVGTLHGSIPLFSEFTLLHIGMQQVCPDGKCEKNSHAVWYQLEYCP